MKKSKSQSSPENSLKSTGPKTAEGKLVSAQNARQHGVLSTHLILPDESREDFEALFEQLCAEFSPEGLMEMTLVERIAVSIWRQRRLVRAETAQIQVRLKTISQSAELDISRSMGLSLQDGDVRNAWNGMTSQKDPQTSDELQEAIQNWAKAYPLRFVLTLDNLEQECPCVYQALLQDAKDAESETVAFFVLEYDGGLRGYIEYHYRDARERWQTARVHELVHSHKEGVCLPVKPETMARYQSSLDNELYKAIRALRELQSWRNDRRIAAASAVVEPSSAAVMDDGGRG